MTEIHFMSMIIIGVGSFIFGILPIVFSLRTRSYPFLLSLILCLGGGVILATSLVHMLTEVQLQLKLYAQLYFCFGFLGLYFLDEITHYCMGDKLEDQAVASDYDSKNNDSQDYGTFDNVPGISQNSPLLKRVTNLPSEDNEQRIGHCYSTSKFRFNENKDENKEINKYLDNCCSQMGNNETHCYLKSGQLCSSNSAPKTGLLIALFIHSVLEGISIGVQTEFSQVIFVLGAVSFHKFVLSFCLGLEIHNHGFKTTHLLLAIFFFSIGSPTGIFLGMTVTSYENGIFGIEAQLQAVAAGSLLYVAAFEVMPRERLKWKHKPKKAAGIFQLLFFLMGFAIITLFHLFVGLAHDNGNKNGTRIETNRPW